MIVTFVGFSLIFLIVVLILKGLTARRLYKSFGFKGLIKIVVVQAVIEVGFIPVLHADELFIFCRK
jgi:hypothetical protein